MEKIPDTRAAELLELEQALQKELEQRLQATYKRFEGRPLTEGTLHELKANAANILDDICQRFPPGQDCRITVTSSKDGRAEIWIGPPPKFGPELNRFCEQLCQAIARGRFSFEFEDGQTYLTRDATALAHKWLDAEERGQRL